MSTLKQKLSKLVESGFAPEDDSELRLKKAALTLVPLIIGPAAFIWGSMYFLLGHPLSGSIPMSYSILSALTLVYYFKTRKVWFLEKSQLLLVLILPFLLMWSLGGFFHGSTVMIWALFAPIAASMFMTKQEAFKWFLAYMLLLFISGFLNSYLEDNIRPLPELAITVFFLLNLGAGSAGLYLLTSFTINQERQAVKETQAANNAKSIFLANMSHELRTPLLGILGYAELGIKKNDPSLDSKSKNYFSQIFLSGERLKVLLDDLLDLSKLEAGKMVLNIECNNLPYIIDSCVNEQEPNCKKRSISIKYDFDEDLPAIECDKNRIGQVIMNILGNAIKFSPDKGVIEISVKKRQMKNTRMKNIDAVLLSVADQGPGIPRGEEEEIFNKFIQSSKTMTNSSGTGLGLAITRELLKAHHGEVWCKNKKEGGAVFYALLPVTQASYIGNAVK